MRLVKYYQMYYYLLFRWMITTIYYFPKIKKYIFVEWYIVMKYLHLLI